MWIFSLLGAWKSSLRVGLQLASNSLNELKKAAERDKKRSGVRTYIE